METYPIPMVPGPVHVPLDIRRAYQADYGASDLEPEFLALYNRCSAYLQKIMATQNQVVILSGEGMLALWSGLKSCLRPGDRVLSIATGLFGDGIGDMAAAIGAEVRKIRIAYDETLADFDAVDRAVAEFSPAMITAVHCETPSGTLNPLAELGRIKKSRKVPLLYVDAVSSIGGTPVLTDEWQIDLCLGGAQKCLSAMADLCFLAVSEAAWEVVEQVDYPGYDALKPFRTASRSFYFPYTPHWQGVAGLTAGAERILSEGLETVFARHARLAEACRSRLVEIGYELFPKPAAAPSPTVTAVRVPDAVGWDEFNRRLRQRGLAVGGSYGPLAGRVFRLGHMGSQADPALLEKALNVIAAVAETF